MQKQIDYADAIKTKYPKQIVIVIAKDNNGKANPVTLGCFMVASGKPPMMAVAIASKHYSVECIRESKSFTIAFTSTEMADDALFFGSKSGRDADKLAESDCKTAPANKIDSVILSDAAANFECTLESETEAGDHIIFVGLVVASHINTEPKQTLYSIGLGYKLGPAG